MSEKRNEDKDEGGDLPERGVISEGFVYNLPPDYDKSQLVGPENMVKAAIFLAHRIPGALLDA